MIRRLGQWILALLIALDHIGYLVLAGLLYVPFNVGPPPSPDLTISAITGFYAERGQLWALVSERIINTLFWFEPDHCRNAVKGDERRALALDAWLAAQQD